MQASGSRRRLLHGANGSNVPVCPTFTFLPARSLKTRRILATTPNELIPAGLSTSNISLFINYIISIALESGKPPDLALAALRPLELLGQPAPVEPRLVAEY